MRPFVPLLTVILGMSVTCSMTRAQDDHQSFKGELNPSSLVKPSTDTWPTYAGDYSQRRFSALTQINQANVKSLALQWISSLPVGEVRGGASPFAERQIPT